MKQIFLRSCFWGALVIIIAVTILILVLLRFGLIKLNTYYEASYRSSCQGKDYLPVEITLNSPDLAKNLMNLSYNVSLSNCQSLPTLPSLEPDFITIPVIGSSNGKTQRMFAYYFYSPSLNISIITFTGTIFVDEWVDDLDMDQVAPISLNGYQEGMMLHHGFYDIYMSIRNKLFDLINTHGDTNQHIIITGHSLGGALATITAFDLTDLDPIVYTFASPRAFNPLMAKIFDSTPRKYTRVYNTEDIIPTAPLAVYFNNLYQHPTIGGMPFTSNLGNDSDNHTLAYLN